MAVYTGTMRSTLRLLLLLTGLVLVAVGSNEQPSLDASEQNLATSPRITYNSTLNLTIARAIEREHLSPIGRAMEDVKTKDPSGDKAGEGNEYEVEEDKEEEEDNDDDEADVSSGEVDEYEDELRGIAESHEAMSRDERRNGISSTTSLPRSLSKNQSSALRNFRLPEKSDEIMSDESSAFNEAMPNEDEEVAELLRYKQKSASPLVDGNFNSRNPELDAKVKRVPTVKKELSTQKEILNANETELSLPKTLVTSVDIANRLDDERKRETRLGTSITSRDPYRYEHLVRDDTNLIQDYSEFKTSGDILRKLDKRQPSELNAPGSYYLDGYNSEQQLRRELQALGLETVADNLMELLTRLSEDPRLWARSHRILADLVGVPVLQESFPDSKKRGYPPDSLMEMPMALESSEEPSDPATTKKPKKKKKKKKKLRQRLINVTSTYKPPTTASPIPPILSTTASNWPATTQAQWRLVAERLFASPWSEEHRETSPSTTKVLSIKNRLATIDDKQRVNLKALNDERQALMLQSAREYSQPRRLHYGKVNTHEKDSSGSSRDNNVKSYGSGIDTPAIDYNLADVHPYQQRPTTPDRYDRYGHYARQRVRDYDTSPVEHERENDYDEIYQAPADVTNRRPFARTQQFRPLGSEYASAKTWQDSRYDYTRPWKDKTRTGLDSIIGTTGKWPWKSASREYKTWTPRYQQPWPRDRNYWQRLDNVEDELEEMMNDDGNENDLPPRNRQRQAPEQSWRTRHDDTGRWQIQRNIDTPSWQIHEKSKSHDREVIPSRSLDENKNHSELSNEVIVKPLVKEKPIVPKITMKTWNSLTSDPATWPFKLTGAKPWPKDKNGKSYNPNAELVRKLGLDKQDRSSTKDTGKVIGKPIQSQLPDKNKIGESSEVDDKRRNDLDTMITSVKNPINWPEKLAGIEKWRSKTRQENDRVPQKELTGQMWQTSMDNDEKIWSGQSPVSPKISSVGAWVMPADQSTWKPYDLKHKVYGQVSAEHRGRWNNPVTPEETDRSFWSSKNEGISGIWPQKSNDWNVIGSVYTPEKSASTDQSANWPSKWRQFTYHKVIAAPLTKTGSLNTVDGSNRPRNSYIAVSAVSPSKYPNNVWRKNDIEETQLDRNSGDNRLDAGFDRDELSSQLRKNTGIMNERWNGRAITSHAKAKDRNGIKNDPLEHQLEELRRGPHWKHELREQSQKRSVTSGNSSNTLVTTEPSQGFVKTRSVDNEILINHTGNVTLTENQTHGDKNVTK